MILMKEEGKRKNKVEESRIQNKKNSKVFEQKGDLLNFKANIDPMAMLSQVKPGLAKLSQAEPS